MLGTLSKQLRPWNYQHLSRFTAVTCAGQRIYKSPGIWRLIKETKFEKVPETQSSMTIKLPDDLNLRGLDFQTGLITPSIILQTAARGTALHFFSTDESSSSFDIAKLSRERLIFVKTAQIQISSSIYNSSLSRYPVSLRLSLLSFRNTSFLSKIDMIGNGTTYASFTMTAISVSMDTRKSVPLPDWWQEKFRTFSGKETAPYFEELDPPQVLICRGVMVEPFTFTVLRHDMDWNGHVNATTYTQYCLDALEDHIYRNNIPCGVDTVFLPLKSCSFFLKGESRTCDILTVAFWDDETNPGSVCFDITKNGKRIYQAIIQVYRGDEVSQTYSKL